MITGNGLNVLSDKLNEKKEISALESTLEAKPTEIIVKHEITIRFDIEHLINQLENN